MDNIKTIFKGDKIVWILFLIFCVISVIEVFSASAMLTYGSGNHWAPIYKHLTYLIIGIFVTCVLQLVPYKWFQGIPLLLYPLAMILLLIVAIFGARINGAARWTEFMGIQFQPSEVAKMAVIILVASILARNQDEDGATSKAFKQILIFTGIAVALIAPENLSTAGILFLVVYVMMFIGRVSGRKLLAVAGILTLVAALFIGSVMIIPEKTLKEVPKLHRLETWKKRINDFISHEDIPATRYDLKNKSQRAYANIAIVQSNGHGKFFGNSTQRDFLSMAYSDFIYAIIIEETGLFGCIGMIVLFFWLLIKAALIARRCDRLFPSLLVMGVALMMVSQAVVNMLVAVGLFPVTGQPLPLISMGGTSTIINCTYIGIILSVSRYTAGLRKKPTTNEADGALAPIEPSMKMFNDDEKLK